MEYHFRGTHAIRFIHLSACLAAAAGLVTPLRTCSVDCLAPFLGLRHAGLAGARGRSGLGAPKSCAPCWGAGRGGTDCH